MSIKHVKSLRGLEIKQKLIYRQEIKCTVKKIMMNINPTHNKLEYK